MVDWLSLLIVFAASLSAAVLVVTLFSLGIRFLATPARQIIAADGLAEPDAPARDDEHDDVDTVGRPGLATAAAYLCFGLCVGCVILGIYLIVPALHG